MLKELGWSAYFDAAWSELAPVSGQPARVVAQYREHWRVLGEFGEGSAEVSGSLRHTAEDGGLWPTVGDWVAVDGNLGGVLRINAVLRRRTEIVRKAAGKRVEVQILAANVDMLLIVMGLDGDYNPRRLERYLTLAWDAGTKPVIILNKSDLCADTHRRVEQMEGVANGTPILVVSAITGEGLGSLEGHLLSGDTVVLLGSSGAGKSNRLLHVEHQAICEVRSSDSRGRHTTTTRQLFLLSSGAMLIDTPGLRELQLWESGQGLQHAFADIEAPAASCRFLDCTHHDEPGCAVLEAILQGSLDPERLENYRKLQRENEFLRRKVDPAARVRAKKSIKVISRAVKQLYDEREQRGKL